MTTAPPEAEAAARNVVKMYVLSDAERDRLVSDHRFAAMAYLRKQTGEWIEVFDFPFTAGECAVTENGEISVEGTEMIEPQSAEERAAVMAWYGYSAYVEATEAIAEGIIGRELEDNPAIEELLRDAIEEHGGEM